MQERAATLRCRSAAGHSLSLSFAFALLVALAPQQLAVDLGDLFDVVFQLVVVLDPASDFRHFLLWNDSAGGAAAAQGYRQIPHRPMPLAASAFTGWVPAGHISLQQRPSQNLRDRRQQLRKALATLAQG